MTEPHPVETLRTAMAAGGIAFGVLGALFPRAFAAIYGLEPTPSMQVVARMWGTRNAALGALTLLAGRDAARRTAAVVTLMTAVDAVQTAASTGLTARSRLLGALSSAVFAASGGLVLAKGAARCRPS